MQIKTTTVQRYAVFLFLFFVFLVIFIFVGFWLHVDINRWTLAAAFGCYTACWLGALRAAKPSTNAPYVQLGVFILVTALLFSGGTAVFDRTYDTSYDGLFDHEPAVLALAGRWDPVYEPKLPLTNPRPASTPFIEGSPKAVWAVEASIYKLTGAVDGATFINLLFVLIALVFVFAGLQELGIRSRLAVVIALTAVATPLLLDQMVTFREDSLSYDCLLIGLASLLFIGKRKQASLYCCCLLGALLLLAGSKFSNAYIFLALAGIGSYLCVRSGLFRVRTVRLLTAGFAAAGIIVLFNPFLTNVFVFHSIAYPYYQHASAVSFRDTGVPANIRQDGNAALFFYGVFASSEIYYANTPSDYARLKLPFTFSRQELALDSLNTSKLVGGYGVLFSGLFVVSIATYVYLFVRARQPSDLHILRWIHIGTALVLLTCLAVTIPNYARYNSQLYLLPLIMVVGLSLSSVRSKPTGKILTGILLVGAACNFCFVVLPSVAEQSRSDSTINRELAVLRNSHKTYTAYSGTFYASYTTLRSHGVPVIAADHPLRCTGELDFYFPPSTPATQLCPTR